MLLIIFDFMHVSASLREQISTNLRLRECVYVCYGRECVPVCTCVMGRESVSVCYGRKCVPVCYGEEMCSCVLWGGNVFLCVMGREFVSVCYGRECVSVCYGRECVPVCYGRRGNVWGQSAPHPVPYALSKSPAKIIIFHGCMIK